MGKGLKTGFMGTPDFAVAALDALHTSAHHEVACIYTQPPRPRGRGQQVQLSPVHDYADAHGLPVYTPKNFKSEKAQMDFLGHELDVAVVAAYGLILPKVILDGPKYGCINIHASLLPRWRGASPIQQAIWAGDEQTGISIMQMDEGLDTGPVIEQRAVPIRPATTATSLHDELAALGGAMIEDIMDELARNGHLNAGIQDDAQATYAPLLRKEDGRIDWQQNAAQIDRQIRALNPWPGTYTEYEGRKIRILEASVPHPPHPASAKAQAKPSHPSPLSPVCEGEGGGGDISRPGIILDRHGRVACGEKTVLKITKIQPAGKKAMDFISAVNGGYFAPGERFS